MKKSIAIIFIFSITLSAFSQSVFDKALSDISNDLADKLIQKNKKKVVVLFITDLNRNPTTAGKYLADMVSFNIINNAGGFSVY